MAVSFHSYYHEKAWLMYVRIPFLRQMGGAQNNVVEWLA